MPVARVLFPVVPVKAAIVQLKAEVGASKEAHGAAMKSHSLQSAQLREENEGLRAQAQQVDTLMARCARLEVSGHMS